VTRAYRLLAALVLVVLCSIAANAQRIAPEKFIPSISQAQNPQCNYSTTATTGRFSIQRAAKFDLIDSYAWFDQCFRDATYGNSWQTMKHYNPDQVVVLYQNGPGLTPQSTPGADIQKTFVLNNHGQTAGDRWTGIGRTYTGTGQFLVGTVGDGYDTTVTMNLRSANWRAYWKDTFGTWGGLANPYYGGTISTTGADGIFADNANYPTVARVCPVPQGPLYLIGHPGSDDCNAPANEAFKDSPADYNLPYTRDNTDWHGLTLAWVNEAVPALRTAYGANFVLIPNWFKMNSAAGVTGTSGWTETNAMTNPPFAGMVEGIVSQQGGHSAVSDDYAGQPNEITFIVTAMQGLTRTKVVFDNTVTGCSNLDSGFVVPNSNSMTCAEHFWHVMGVFLLGFDTELGNGYMGYGDHNDIDWQDEWDPAFLHLGHQIGLAQKIGSIWWRQFDDAWVAVNSVSSTVSGITLPGGIQGRVCTHANFKISTTCGSASPVSSFSLTANRAAILLKSGKSITNSDNPIIPAVLTITTTSPLPGGTEGAGYSQTILASGGTAPYTWSTLSGTLPTGITRTGAVLSGTPTVAGIYTFTIRVTDSLAVTDDQAYSLTIAASPGGGDPATYARSQISSDVFTNASTACLDPYSANWARIHDGGTTNCVKVDATNDVIYGTPNSYEGWVARRTETFGSNQYASLKITALPADNSDGLQFVGVGARIAAGTGVARNLYEAVIYKVAAVQTTALVKVVAGVLETLVSSSTEVWTVGARIEIEVYGSEIRVLHDGAVVSGLTFTDTTPITGGAPGVAMAGGSGTVATGDDFLAGNLVPAGSYHISRSTGSDSNAGTSAAPFATINKALSVMSAGQDALLCAGACNGAGSDTYLIDIDDTVQAPPSGTSFADAPGIKAYPGEAITVKPTTAKCNVVNLTTVDYVRFEDLIFDADDLNCGSPAAIVLDATHTGTQTTGSTTRTLTSVVTSSTSNAILIVALDYDNNTQTGSGCVYNTTETMTLLGYISGVNYHGTSIYYPKAPSVTTASVVCSGVDTSLTSSISALSLHNVDQTNPFRDVDTGNGTGTTTGTLTLTTVSGDFVIDFVGEYNHATPGMTPGAGQTEIYDYTATSGQVAGSTRTASGTTTGMVYSWTDSRAFVHTAMALTPAGSGGSGTTTGISIASGSTNIRFTNVTTQNATGDGVLAAGAGMEYLGGRVTANGKGITITGANSTVDGAEIDTNTMRGVIASANDITIQNNNIHDNTTDGIASAGSITGLRIYNNALSVNGGLDISLTASAPTGAQIYHNTANSNHTPTVSITAGSGHLFTNNIVYPGTISAAAATLSHNTTANPLFVSAPTNLAVGLGSPAIAAGLDLTASVPTDINGSARSNPPTTGAYEFMAIPVITGITPKRVAHARAVSVTITGTDLDATTPVINFSSTGVTASSVVQVDPQTITATFTTADNAPLGCQTVTLDSDAGTGIVGGQFCVTTPTLMQQALRRLQ
jgi:hypothetical protein